MKKFLFLMFLMQGTTLFAMHAEDKDILNAFVKIYHAQESQKQDSSAESTQLNEALSHLSFIVKFKLQNLEESPLLYATAAVLFPGNPLYSKLAVTSMKNQEGTLRRDTQTLQRRHVRNTQGYQSLYSAASASTSAVPPQETERILKNLIQQGILAQAIELYKKTQPAASKENLQKTITSQTT